MGFSQREWGRDHRGHRSGGPVRPIFDSSEGYGAKPDYKTAALCKQVRRALSLALAGDCGDEVLQNLVVDEVLPAPNAGRLLARVVLRAAPGVNTSVADILHRLESVRGHLRARIGEGIVRKRTPELAFDVLIFNSPSLAPEATPEAGHE